MIIDFAKVRGLDSTGELMLLSTKDWFRVADGEQYMSIWGRCRLVEAKDALGICS